MKNVFGINFRCGHCKRLHPLWEELAGIMNAKDDPQVIIARVDCTQQHALCSKHDITGYPTIRFFKQGDVDNSVKFTGTRDMSTLSEFIISQLHPAESETEINGTSGIDKDDQKIGFQAIVSGEKNALVELTDVNFAQHISSGNHFVKFYAPWCSHCQRLAPIWDKLAMKLRDNHSVSIAKLDCTAYRPICKDFEVKSYPTLLWIEDGKKIEKYSGDRNVEDLYLYVQKMLGLELSLGSDLDKNGNVLKQDEEQNKLQVLQLSGHNYQETLAKGIVFIKFYAPWCGHCQKLKPIWEKLAKTIHGNSKLSHVKIAEVDCMRQENKELCRDEQIAGFPTLLAYRNRNRQLEYESGRSLDSLVQYVHKLVGHDEL